MDTRPQTAGVGPARQRLVFRAVSDFMTRLAGRFNERHGGDFVRAMLWLAFSQASRGPPSMETLRGPPRPVSIRAISRSMRIPYETTRRKLLEMEREGVCRRAPDNGMILAPGVLDSADRRATAAADCQALRELVGQLRGLGFDPLPYGAATPSAARPAAADIDLVAAAMMEDFILRTIEFGAGIHGSLLDALVFLALLTLNAEPLTFDLEAAWRYAGAETPPPAILRRPVALSRLARTICLPRETVRRRLLDFQALGWVEHLPDGYLIATARTQAPEVLESGATISLQFVQLVLALGQIGFELPEGPGQLH